MRVLAKLKQVLRLETPTPPAAFRVDVSFRPGSPLNAARAEFTGEARAGRLQYQLADGSPAEAVLHFVSRGPFGRGYHAGEVKTSEGLAQVVAKDVYPLFRKAPRIELTVAGRPPSVGQFERAEKSPGWTPGR